MRERIRQPGVAQLCQAVPERFDEVGRWLTQRPEAKVVLDNVGRDPNFENLALQNSIEHAIPAAIRSDRSGWSFHAETKCLQVLGNVRLSRAAKVHDEHTVSLGRAIPICFHTAALLPTGIVPSQAWMAPPTSSRQSGILTPTIRRKAILVTTSLYGQDGTDVRLA